MANPVLFPGTCPNCSLTWAEVADLFGYTEAERADIAPYASELTEELRGSNGHRIVGRYHYDDGHTICATCSHITHPPACTLSDAECLAARP